MSITAVRSSRAAAAAPDVPQPRRSEQRERLAAVEIATAQRRRRSLLVSGIVGAALIASLFAVVTMHVQMAQNQYGLKDTRKDIAARQLENLQLKSEVAKMSAPDWIVPQAKRLGLVIPQQVTVLSVDEGGLRPDPDPSKSSSSPSQSSGAAAPSGGSSAKVAGVPAP